MQDLGKVLALWRAASQAREPWVLATVVEVEGSSYRKPGARMMLTRSGQRAGSISGGCLEGEVSRKAWWLTESGPAVQQYSTFFDIDGDVPYGLGCGGRVSVLLERPETAQPLMERLQACYEQRVPCALATPISGPATGPHFLEGEASTPPALAALASQAAGKQTSFWSAADFAGQAHRVFAEYVPPRPGLFLFGAGDDAQPLVEIAALQDWYIQVTDGRSNLATRERFPSAHAVQCMRGSADVNALALRRSDAAVLMTHSYEQDGQWLRALLPLGLRYLGVLGPRQRTRRLLEEIAPGLGWTVEECEARVKSPVGLNLGGETPAAIALSIAAEVEAASHRGRNTAATYEQNQYVTAGDLNG